MISDQGKRTNSLAFAQTNCHTCASLGDKCDRRRPRCSTCLGQGRRCGGFATPLSWDPRRMVNYSADGASKNLPDEEIVAAASSSKTVPTASAARSNSNKQFRFVKGATRPKKRRRKCSSQREHGSRSIEPEVSSATTAEVVLRETGRDLEISNDYQRGNILADLGKSTSRGKSKQCLKAMSHVSFRRTARGTLC